MKVEFLKSFSKDLDSINQKAVKANLVRIIESLEKSSSLDDILGIKKLKGAKNAYRIRLGDFRLAFFSDKSTVELARFLHRKDIYKFFP